MTFAPDLALAPQTRSRLNGLLPSPPPALLICGPRGSGKLHLARTFAAAALCRSKSARPCLRCQPCASADAATIEHSDPERGLVKVDDAARLREAVSERLVTGTYLFVLLEGADRLHPAAANMLLKLIEEPPSYVRFLLTADARSRVISTIRSRSQIVRVAAPAAEDLAQVFRERLDALPDGPARLAAARGLPGRLTMLLEDASWDAETARRRDIEAAARGDAVARLSQAAEIAKAEVVPAFLEDLSRELAISLRGTPGGLFAGRPPRALALALQASLRARRLVDRGARPQLALENALLQLP